MKNSATIIEFGSLPMPQVVQSGQTKIEELVITQLVKHNLTIGCAESCTGGYISHLLTNVSGSSAAFTGAHITYSNQQKMRQLEVNSQTLEQYGAVSLEVVQQMGAGARSSLQSDCLIAITGIAGPGGGSKEKPVGTAFTAILTPSQSNYYLLQLEGDRPLLKERFAQYALTLLYNQLINTKENL